MNKLVYNCLFHIVPGKCRAKRIGQIERSIVLCGRRTNTCPQSLYYQCYQRCRSARTTSQNPVECGENHRHARVAEFNGQSSDQRCPPSWPQWQSRPTTTAERLLVNQSSHNQHQSDQWIQQQQLFGDQQPSATAQAAGPSCGAHQRNTKKWRQFRRLGVIIVVDSPKFRHNAGRRIKNHFIWKYVRRTR